MGKCELGGRARGSVPRKPCVSRRASGFARLPIPGESRESSMTQLKWASVGSRCRGRSLVGRCGLVLLAYQRQLSAYICPPLPSVAVQVHCMASTSRLRDASEDDEVEFLYQTSACVLVLVLA